MQLLKLYRFWNETCIYIYNIKQTPLKMLFKKLNEIVEESQARKNNIYVYIELTRLVQKLEMGGDDFKSTLVKQAAYLHLINPKDLSVAFASDWIAIKNFVGYDGSAKISNAEMMRAPIREKVKNFTQDDINTLMMKLRDLQARLEAEFSA